METSTVMRPFLSLRILSFFVLVVLLLSACAGAAVTSAPTAAPTIAPVILGETETPQPTATLYPSQTPLPTHTPSITPTLPPTATLMPTPDAALSEAKLIGLAWLEKYKYNLMVSFEFPGPVDPEDYRVTLEDKVYRCEVLVKYPNRLYCNGQGAKVLASAVVRVYPAGSDQAGFEKSVWVPFFNP
jgi:hypothetical protein